MRNLYIIATDIGDINENTFSAIETLKKCDLVFCESLEKISNLEKHFGFKSKKIIKLNNFNENLLVSKINLESLFNIALISDAGYPLISDPGFPLVKKIMQNKEWNVKVINGPSSILPALLLSGFPTHSFFFSGFLPKKETQINKKIIESLKIKTTIIFFESPHRINKTITLMKKLIPGEDKICLIREISKKFEEKIIIKPETNKIIEKGEFVIIINNNE